MKKFFILATMLILLSAALWASDIPDYVGYVNDFANVITDKSKTEMEEVAKDLEEKTGAQIAVITVRSIAPYASIEDFSMAVAEKWKPGQKEKDTGIIMVLAMDERMFRIEVGYGLEGIINDAKAGRIIDNTIMPYFKGGDFSAGLRRGLFKIADTIGTEMEVELDVRTKIDNSKSEALCMLIFMIIFIAILVMMIHRMNTYRRTGRRYYGNSFGAMYPGYGHSRGSFGGFSNRGCDGFGGFGGGGFGGGGASRGF